VYPPVRNFFFHQPVLKCNQNRSRPMSVAHNAKSELYNVTYVPSEEKWTSFSQLPEWSTLRMLRLFDWSCDNISVCMRYGPFTLKSLLFCANVYSCCHARVVLRNCCLVPLRYGTAAPNSYEADSCKWTEWIKWPLSLLSVLHLSTSNGKSIPVQA